MTNKLFRIFINISIILIIILSTIGILKCTNAQQTISASIMHDNIQRDYIAYVPASYSPTSSTPLLFCFHGYTSNANNILNYSNFNSIADTGNFIVVYPQGTLFNGLTHWNVGGWTLGSTVDDVGFVDALIDSLIADYNINTDQIYATGMSNGGYMSFLLACQLSHRIAAIASVTGSMTPQTYNMCNPQHPTPVLQIHGDADGTVPYQGDPSWTMSIPDVIEYWVNYNQCDTAAIFTALPDIITSDGSYIELYQYPNGLNSASTEHYKVINGDHHWPGAFGNMDISASSVVWRFLSQYDINGKVNSNPNSIEENQNTLTHLLSYPNPVIDFLHIENSSKHDSPFKFYSTSGQLLRQGILKQGNNQIDLKSFSPNVYILRIGYFVQKIIKTN